LPSCLSCKWKLPTTIEQARYEGASAVEDTCAEFLQQALSKSGFVDVQFEIDGMIVAGGHRSVLSARSPVFACMLRNDMQENHTGIVKLLDVSRDTFLAFLELIYLGTITLLFSRHLFANILNLISALIKSFYLPDPVVCSLRQH
jgi:hypothetical protein